MYCTLIVQILNVSVCDILTLIIHTETVSLNPPIQIKCKDTIFVSLQNHYFARTALPGGG